jgi:hypothetical protein
MSCWECPRSRTPRKNFGLGRIQRRAGDKSGIVPDQAIHPGCAVVGGWAEAAGGDLARLCVSLRDEYFPDAVAVSFTWMRLPSSPATKRENVIAKDSLGRFRERFVTQKSRCLRAVLSFNVCDAT